MSRESAPIHSDILQRCHSRYQVLSAKGMERTPAPSRGIAELQYFCVVAAAVAAAACLFVCAEIWCVGLGNPVSAAMMFLEIRWLYRVRVVLSRTYGFPAFSEQGMERTPALRFWMAALTYHAHDYSRGVWSALRPHAMGAANGDPKQHEKCCRVSARLPRAGGSVRVLCLSSRL